MYTMNSFDLGVEKSLNAYLLLSNAKVSPMSKPQPVSPLQLNMLLSQRLILAELMKISDILAKQPLKADYSIEAQKQMAEEMKRTVRVQPAENENAGKTRAV